MLAKYKGGIVLKLSKFLDKVWRRLDTIIKILAIMNGVIIITWIIIARRGFSIQAIDLAILFTGVLVLPDIIKRMLTSLRQVIWQKKPLSFDFRQMLEDHGLEVVFYEQSEDLHYYNVVEKGSDYVVFCFAISPKINAIISIIYPVELELNGEMMIGEVNSVLRDGKHSCFATAEGLLDRSQPVLIETVHVLILESYLQTKLNSKGIGTTSFYFKTKF